MTHQISFSNSKIDKAMSVEQFEQIVDAILNGKYSWACLLILRFAGYNPLHYIPYRTYNRLMKENCQIGKSSQPETDKITTKHKSSQSLAKGASAPGCLKEFQDLAYVDAIDKQKGHPRGGSFYEWIEWKNYEVPALIDEASSGKNHEFFLTYYGMSS